MTPVIDATKGKEMLRKAGFPVIASTEINSLEELLKIVKAISSPVVVKFISSIYPHKSDIGGVKTNLSSPKELAEAFSQMESLKKDLDPSASIVVEPMIPNGFEFFVGFKQDSDFGPIIMFGMGGILVELFKEVRFRLLPADDQDLLRMCRQLKNWEKLRKGFRNLPPIKEGEILKFLKNFSGWAIQQNNLIEVDINPLIFYRGGLSIVDVRMVLKE